jgi:hypothetical protein
MWRKLLIAAASTLPAIAYVANENKLIVYGCLAVCLFIAVVLDSWLLLATLFGAFIGAAWFFPVVHAHSAVEGVWMEFGQIFAGAGLGFLIGIILDQSRARKRAGRNIEPPPPRQG